MDGTTSCVFMEEDVTLEKLSPLTSKYSSKDIKYHPVLLLEMTETDIDPVSYIAILVQTSNRKVEELTKTISKTAVSRYMIINPPTKKELCAMARSSVKYGSNSVFKGLSDEEIDKLVS